MPQTISKVKDDFEEINQFLSFRVADAELKPSSVRGGEDFTLFGFYFFGMIVDWLLI